MKVKKGDKVKVITGKFKGTEGLVSKVLTKKERVLVEGVNVKKKALKTKESENNENFVFVQHSIHVSNVKKLDAVSEDTKTTKKGEKKKATKAKSK